ncbi:MAG TPA: RsmD family RNA methyltransferase [Candidatus Saccharimonadia bacterium]
MKILSGRLGGRTIEQPPSRSTRPLSEKVRAALFDVVGDPEDLVVLDAYAGSGAAGLEALSRGALLVEAIEANARAARSLQANARALDVDAAHILHQQSVESWLASPQQQPPSPRYGLIIADPPYAQLKADVIGRLAVYLTDTGVLVLSHASRLAAPELPSANLIKTKAYGDTALSFYRRS